MYHSNHFSILEYNLLVATHNKLEQIFFKNINLQVRENYRTAEVNHRYTGAMSILAKYQKILERKLEREGERVSE